MIRSSKNCPAQRLILSDDSWRTRCYTMLAFCCACHIGTFAVAIAVLLN